MPKEEEPIPCRCCKATHYLAEEFNWTADELIDWYQHDMTDVARLAIADIRFTVGDYIENHHAARRNDPDGDKQSADCYRIPAVSKREGSLVKPRTKRRIPSSPNAFTYSIEALITSFNTRKYTLLYNDIIIRAIFII